MYDGPGNIEGDQLEVTRSLIEYDSQRISIRRPGPAIRRADGSIDRNAESVSHLWPQDLYFSGITADDQREVDWRGHRTSSTYILIGMPDADFQEGDTFDLWGRKWGVAEVHEDRRWQRKAWCVNYG